MDCTGITASSTFKYGSYLSMLHFIWVAPGISNLGSLNPLALPWKRDRNSWAPFLVVLLCLLASEPHHCQNGACMLACNCVTCRAAGFLAWLVNFVPSPSRQLEAAFQLLQQLAVALQLARSHYRSFWPLLVSM